MNILEQLKQNEKPFGLMSEEMQAKAKEIGKTEFDWFRAIGAWESTIGEVFVSGCVYRLRADYEDENEIEECEIFTDKFSGFLRCRLEDGLTMDIDAAPHYPDFIGFKFEDGTVLAVSVMYHFCGNRTDETSIHEEKDDEAKVLHATHVCFRRKKQE